ncbi:MAG: hypothetical protein VYE77_09620 [Planctomycetota bacterium]|nr:hypothetical protein [Planctomycetota bacterium]
MTEPPAALRERLPKELDDLAGRAVGPIRRVRAQQARARAWHWAWRVLWWVPAALVVFQLGRLLVGAQASAWSFSMLLGMALVPAVVAFAGVLGAAWLRPVGRRQSLAVLDEAADLRDRLVIADEFLRASDKSGFMVAALDDAAAHLEEARRVQLVKAPPEARRTRPPVVAGLLAALLLWGVSTLSQLQWQATGSVSGNPGEVGQDVARNAPVSDRDLDAQPAPPRDPQAETRLGASVDSAAADDEGQAGEDIKETRGQFGSGRPAQASASQGSSRSQAAPTNQSASIKVEEPQKAKPKKAKEPERPVNKSPPPQKRPGEESGSTAGRGSSRGSNKNPANTDWASKDQVTNPEDEGVEDDQEIEDEEEEQESRGGIQPNLRDRKPPVNRDLRIGFGNGKNPDANGRGGPSEQKKSRGVASLVLGVPVPDRIKGQPNRGKTKITQERIEPKAEDAQAIDAQARTAREQPMGPVVRYDLELWMQQLVRRYFTYSPDSSN